MAMQKTAEQDRFTILDKKREHVDQHSISREGHRRAIVESMWLSYYNNVLLEQGLIDEAQHRRMQSKISCRRPA